MDAAQPCRLVHVLALRAASGQTFSPPLLQTLREVVMFGTWKYDPETDEMQNLRRAYDPVAARSSQHQACDRCHEKKLKCSGDRTGCDRCAASGQVCEYTRSRSRSCRKGRKSGRNSAESPGHTREASGSPSSHASSQRGPSPNPRSRGSSLRRARTSAPAASPGPAPGGHDDSLLSGIDFSVPSQQHVFGMNPFATGAITTDYAPPPSMPQFLQPQQHEATTAYQPVWTTGYQPMNAMTSTTLSMDLSYLTTDGEMCGTDASGYLPYESYQGFEDYSNVDPRYWPQDPPQ